MSDAEFTVEGLPEVQSALEGLPGHERRNVLRRAIAPAGEIVRASIAAAAPVGATGKLKASITFAETLVGDTPSGKIYPDRRRGKGGSRAHLVEDGTAPHKAFYYGHAFQHPGTRGRPFFHAGADAAAGQALDVMERVTGEGAEEYWNGQSAGGGE